MTQAITFKTPDEERAITRHELARFQAGELDDARRVEITAALEADAALKAEYAELENDKRAFQASMPFERFAARAEAAAPKSFFDKLRAFRWQLGGFTACAGAAAAVLFLVTPSGDVGGSGTGAGTHSKIQLKGQGHLGLFVRDGDVARIGADGEELHPGDQIQFVLRDDHDLRSMVLLGVDGKGVVTVYDSRALPSTTSKGATPSGGMTEGSARKTRVMEQSVILDDALGPERFFVLYSDEDPDKLKRNAQRAARMLAASKADLTQAEKLEVSGLAAKQSSIYIVKTQP